MTTSTTSTSTTSTTTTTQPPTTTTTTRSTTTTADPAAVYVAWLAVLNQNYLPLYQTDLADAIETSYYWIDSVDKVSFDATQNEFTFDATILFASVYENDLQEWQDDTWDFFRDYAKDIWIPLMEGVNDAWTKDLGTPEWRQWTSSVLLDGNAGRLTVECPGSLIFDLTGRAATQADFQEICTFGN